MFSSLMLNSSTSLAQTIGSRKVRSRILDLAGLPLTLHTGRLSLSASSIACLDLLVESEWGMLCTCENDPDSSGLRCEPVLCGLLPIPSATSTGAALSNENVPVSELFMLMESWS